MTFGQIIRYSLGSGNSKSRQNIPGYYSLGAIVYAYHWLSVPVSHYRIAPRKVFPDLQFTGKNLLRPAAAQAGRYFTGKLSAGGDFFGGDPIMGRLIP